MLEIFLIPTLILFSWIQSILSHIYILFLFHYFIYSPLSTRYNQSQECHFCLTKYPYILLIVNAHNSLQYSNTGIDLMLYNFVSVYPSKVSWQKSALYCTTYHWKFLCFIINLCILIVLGMSQNLSCLQICL